MDKWLKIGVDLHGVIDRNDIIFKMLSVAVRLSGVKIYIISGPPKEDVEKELRSLNIFKSIHYDEVHTIVDYLRTQPVEMWKDEKNTWWTADENWWSAKSAICKKLGITLMIDNTDKYKPYFKGTGIKFILYDDMV